MWRCSQVRPEDGGLKPTDVLSTPTGSMKSMSQNIVHCRWEFQWKVKTSPHHLSQSLPRAKTLLMDRLALVLAAAILGVNTLVSREHSPLPCLRGAAW